MPAASSSTRRRCSGLRLDDLADAALVHERRRARAGRGVGEQRSDVAGAHLAAVDAVDRALLALDAARDVERVGVVERGRRLAVGVVDQDRDLGVVARRAGRNCRRRSRRPSRRRASPCSEASPITQRTASTRFDLPQPFGPTTPVSPGSISKVGRLDEGLEADQAQPRELHACIAFLPLAAAAKGIVEGSRRTARRGCRIGAENELSGLIAQQARGVIQISAPARARTKLLPSRGAARRRGEKPLSVLEIRVDTLGQ